jgi:hypothetical protein
LAAARKSLFTYSITDDQFVRLTEISQAPRCWFTLGDNRGGQVNALNTLEQSLAANVDELTRKGELDAALERLVVWRRLCAHAVQYQTAAPIYHFNSTDYGTGVRYSESLSRWAEAEGQTRERLVRAATLLSDVEAMFPGVQEQIVASLLEVRRVVEDLAPPTFHRGNDKLTTAEWEALAMNQLPWERRRALSALNRIAEWKLLFANTVLTAGYQSFGQYPHGSAPRPRDVERRLFDAGWEYRVSGLVSLPNPGVLGEYQSWEALVAENQILEASATSALTAMEVSRRGVYVDELLRT